MSTSLYRTGIGGKQQAHAGSELAVIGHQVSVQSGNVTVATRVTKAVASDACKGLKPLNHVDGIPAARLGSVRSSGRQVRGGTRAQTGLIGGCPAGIRVPAQGLNLGIGGCRLVCSRLALAGFELIEGRNDDPRASYKGLGPRDRGAVGPPQGPGKLRRAVIVLRDGREVFS